MAYEVREGEFVVSDELARIDLEVVHGFLTACYWSAGIPRATVERAARHSMTFGLYHAPDGRQVGYARVVTDRATYAYLCDVFVLDAWRGRGLGVFLVRALLAHPDLQGLRRFALFTRDAHRLYARFGFEPMGDPTRYMERVDRKVYVLTNTQGLSRVDMLRP